MEINLKATYNLDDEQILALFWTALTSGSIGYGCLSLDCSTEAYHTAREAVRVSKGGEPDELRYICIEDVLTEVLRAGKLRVLEYDEVDDSNNLIKEVGVEDLYHNLNKMQEQEPWILDEFAKQNDDANTHDAFLQYVLLGDIIYG